MGNAAAPAGTSAIERTLDFRASRDRVWLAITDERELSTWFGARCAIDLRVGGTGRFEWPEEGDHGVRIQARVEAFDPPERLAWRWARESDTPVDEGPSTLVEWRLEALAGGGTRLHLRETGFERPGDRLDNAHGWQQELAELAAVVASVPFEAGIHRTWSLQASPERVWAAFTDPLQLAEWWSHNPLLVIEPGASGYWDWVALGGRFAMRWEAIEPPSYLCWSWVTEPDVPLADAGQVLRTEWVLMPREDGGTDLTLFESGFTSDGDFHANSGGWHGDVIQSLRRFLGEVGSAG